ncbi:hypothetical protein O1611_g6113 [Lasiodiplodia mahajangana]|uniref:Uncharacterized protein n=1 Tax=Lasiodiplodia mahajangana TaxID=1108764 RepID=A0ACC2JJY8_9PEZI|nr:hypothetical protein O1611_g6113 [Lasiodiplodia mahajangana]
MTLPDQRASAVQALLGPFLNSLGLLGIEYNLTTSNSESYFDHFNTYLGPLPYGQEPATTTLMSRLIPKATAFNTTKMASFVDAVRYIVEDGDFLVGCLVLNASSKSHPDNSVLPAWREAITGCNINAYWDFAAPLETNLAVKRKMVDTYVPAFEMATPGGGVYMNEIDPWYQGDWKKELYGEAYDRLASIKQTYDPSHLFWGKFNVGGDSLYLDGEGRLCQP